MTRDETDKPGRSAVAARERGSERGAPDLGAPTGKPARQRIARAVARAGLCSRRDAEAWIIAGRIQVNGEILSSPARDVSPDDAILVDGVPLPAAEKTRLFLFHKPRGLVTSDHDPDGRETVADYLRENWPDGPRVVTVGRLDINTEGLLLLTNDGGLARMLELPETGWLRRYRVRAKGETDQGALDTLAAGIAIDGISYAGIEATLDRIQGSNCWLTMGLREGKNREIKRVLEHLGLEVNRLIRVSFGPFQLLDLPDGAVEEVRTRVLRDQLGEALAAAAGVDFGDGDPRPPSAHGASGSAEIGRGASRLRPLAAGPAERRGPPTSEPAIERRLRPEGAPRRHVSALRKPDRSKSDAADEGPRRRIERSRTVDRHDRPIIVERVSTVEGSRPPGRKRDSPSAEAKRVRTARSGGTGPGRNDRFGARDGRRPSFEQRERREGGRRTETSAADDARRWTKPAGPGKPKRFGDVGRPATSGRETDRRSGRPEDGKPRSRPEARQGGEDRRFDRPDRASDDKRPARGAGAGTRWTERRSDPPGRPSAGRPGRSPRGPTDKPPRGPTDKPSRGPTGKPPRGPTDKPPRGGGPRGSFKPFSKPPSKPER